LCADFGSTILLPGTLQTATEQACLRQRQRFLPRRTKPARRRSVLPAQGSFLPRPRSWSVSHLHTKVYRLSRTRHLVSRTRKSLKRCKRTYQAICAAGTCSGRPSCRSPGQPAAGLRGNRFTAPVCRYVQTVVKQVKNDAQQRKTKEQLKREEESVSWSSWPEFHRRSSNSATVPRSV